MSLCNGGHRASSGDPHGDAGDGQDVAVEEQRQPAQRLEEDRRDVRARYGSWRLATDSPGYLVQPDREVIDGQHRLHAIIQSGVTVQMAVATGFFSEYDSPIDQGRRRSARDILHRHNRWVAIVRMLRRMQVGNVTIDTKMSIAEITESAAVHSEALRLSGPLCAHSRRGSFRRLGSAPVSRIVSCPSRPRSPRARCLSVATRRTRCGSGRRGTGAPGFRRCFCGLQLLARDAQLRAHRKRLHG